MGMPAAKANDQVLATDTHIVLLPPYATPTPLPHPFNGLLDGGLAGNVNIMGQAAATVNSTAGAQPPHLPQGGPFQRPPGNTAQVLLGSLTVSIGGQPAARQGDPALTCNDPADLPGGTVLAAGTVFIG
ncbi:PAAR domain-containing protein [Thiohalocapsa sp. ML1]|uniref:PAAR domain-containing protein n=1 Tax=Thiohalocapsa sp. ML1 TaxID=1431688 RepID=UPI000731FC15|nr:PAAR domain-containing protein [Thiohalocapsa sp. ML1]